MHLKKFNFYEKKNKNMKGGFRGKISKIQNVLTKILDVDSSTSTNSTNSTNSKKEKIIFYKATDSNKIKRTY